MTAPQHRRFSPAPVDSFDAQIDQEWREFRAELADVVAGLDDEVVDVQVSTGGAPEFLQADLQIVIRRDEERPDVLLVSVPRNEQLGPFASTLSRGQLAKVRHWRPMAGRVKAGTGGSCPRTTVTRPQTWRCATCVTSSG